MTAISSFRPTADEDFQADDRFFWNKHLQSRFIDLAGNMPAGGDISGFILPALFGCASVSFANQSQADRYFHGSLRNQDSNH